MAGLEAHAGFLWLTSASCTNIFRCMHTPDLKRMPGLVLCGEKHSIHPCQISYQGSARPAWTRDRSPMKETSKKSKNKMNAMKEKMKRNGVFVLVRIHTQCSWKNFPGSDQLATPPNSTRPYREKQLSKHSCWSTLQPTSSDNFNILTIMPPPHTLTHTNTNTLARTYTYASKHACTYKHANTNASPLFSVTHIHTHKRTHTYSHTPRAHSRSALRSGLGAEQRGSQGGPSE